MDKPHAALPAKDIISYPLDGRIPQYEAGRVWSIDSIHPPGLDEPDLSTDSLPEFEYGPQLPEGHIRFLMLVPPRDGHCSGDQNWVLACDLLSNLQNKYTAISYTWGDPAKTRRIRCNGKSLAVCENVYEALRNISVLFESGKVVQGLPVLWIDALCINQGNFAERGGQVKMMRDIYRSASNTLVWLPVGRAASQQDLDDMHKGWESMKMLSGMYGVRQFRDLLHQGRVNIDTLDHMKCGEKSLRVSWDSRGGIKKLFTHAWFERIWICQEIAVSTKAMVFDGSHIGPWKLFVDTAEVVHHLGGLDSFERWTSGGLAPAKTFMGNVRRLESLRERVEDRTHTCLLELLHATANFQSTLALDRVYGLLGLITDKQDQEIITSFLNYNMAPYILYLNITVNHIIQHGTLDILHLVGPVQPDPAGKWLSIVPNLGASNNYMRSIGTFKTRNEWIYQASLDSKPEIRVDGVAPQPGKIITITDANKISLSGFIVDSVCCASEMLESAGMCMASMLTWFQTAMFGNSSTTFIPSGVIERHLNYLASRAKAAGEVPASEDDEPAENSSDEERPVPDKIDPEILKLLENVKLDQDGKPAMASSDGLVEIETEWGRAIPVPASNQPSDPMAEPYPGGRETYGSAFWRTLIGDRDPRRPGSNVKPDADFAEKYFHPWSELIFRDDGDTRVSRVWMSKWPQEHGHAGDKAVMTFARWVEDVSLGRKLFRTEKGYIGTAPVSIKDGDLICVLKGGQTPYALRRDDGGFKFVGACYVHGLMDGEALVSGLEGGAFVFHPD